MTQATPDQAAGGFPIDLESPVLAKHKRRKKTPFWRSPLMIVLVLLASAAGGVYHLWQRQQAAQGMELAAIEPITTDEEVPIELALPFTNPEIDRSKLTLELLEAPEGATLDPETATFHWTPTREQANRQYAVTVQAQSKLDRSVTSRQRFMVTVNKVESAPELEHVESQTVEKGAVLKLPLNLANPDESSSRLRWELVGTVPAGASLDENLGILEWYTGSDEVEVGKTYEFEVRVSNWNNPELSATRKIQATVRLADPFAKLKEYLASTDSEVETPDRELEGPFAGKGRQLLVDSERLDVFTYSSQATADKDQEFIAPDLSRYFGKKPTWDLPTKIYRDERIYVVASGVSPELHRRLTYYFGIPIAAVGDFSESSVASTEPPSGFERPTATETPPDAPSSAVLDDVGYKLLEALYKDGKLLNKKNYEQVRAIQTSRFAARYEDVIDRVYGTDRDALEAWFDENPNIKEELYTAIDPGADNVPAVLGVFLELWKHAPETVQKYDQLAIATAVVWDDPRRGVYDYTQHQRRTGSIMPEDKLAGMLENFDYLSGNEKIMEGRTRLVPWEFLIHLVNHRTPLEEREWAVKRYLPKRVMFGECYDDVPYDHVMLESGSRQCKLQGEEYTLANIRSLGGVCAMQADFAARVGKSLGVPAAYVRGDIATGSPGGHAWVMWVELKNLTKTGINFSLESHGRYEGYESLKMYVGELNDPQTGRLITDRELELRLHTVGLDPLAKRQAGFIMSAYPQLRERLKFSLDEQVDFLEQVIKLSPGNEAAWLTLAEIAGSGNLAKNHQRQMKRVLDGLFATFANFPDFTWKVFDDLIQYEEGNLNEQIKLYTQLLNLYVAAGRPDLACEARLMLTGYQVDANKPRDAVEGLAATIMAFPDDARYVPRMLDRLELLVAMNVSFQPHLIKFYKAFLPKVPTTRAGKPTPFAIAMYERGITRFDEANDSSSANKYRAALAKLRE
jgi:hypothetical protein